MAGPKATGSRGAHLFSRLTSTRSGGGVALEVLDERMTPAHEGGAALVSLGRNQRRGHGQHAAHVRLLVLRVLPRWHKKQAAGAGLATGWVAEESGAKLHVPGRAVGGAARQARAPGAPCRHLARWGLPRVLRRCSAPGSSWVVARMPREVELGTRIFAVGNLSKPKAQTQPFGFEPLTNPNPNPNPNPTTNPNPNPNPKPKSQTLIPNAGRARGGS